MRFLPGLLNNLTGQVDGVIALDDQSTDGSGDFMAGHPLVIELLTVPLGAQEELEDGLNHRALTEASWKHGADWLFGIDADERVERRFRHRAETAIASAEATGHDALWVPFKELWDARSLMRADGIWGEKRKACLFKSSEDHVFDTRRVHAIWASLAVPPERLPEADLRLYHLRMIDPGDRRRRVERYARVDPEHLWQTMGYDYMLDNSGLRLSRVERRRGFRD